MNIPVDQWNAALKAVLVKAATDIAFRSRCLNKPAAVIREASGLIAPAGFRFSEEPDGDAVVLPPLGVEPDEITDSELLTNVAGGDGPTVLFSLDDKPKQGQNCYW